MDKEPLFFTERNENEVVILLKNYFKDPVPMYLTKVVEIIDFQKKNNFN